MSEDFHQKMILKYGEQKYLPDNWQYKKSRVKTKLIYGVGINDVEFSVQPNIDGKQLKHIAYQVWSGMLQRAYSDKYKSTRPTYIGVTVADEWKTFSTFLSWFNNHYISGFALDKDILIEGNKKYSPETCIFVPPNINTFSTLSTASRGMLPIGVDAQNDKYRAHINNGRGIDKYLGTFNSKEEAHKAWQKAKLEQAIAFNFPALDRIIKKLKYYIENNLTIETL